MKGLEPLRKKITIDFKSIMSTIPSHQKIQMKGLEPLRKKLQ